MLAEPAAALALPFVGGHPFGHAVHYLAWENLKGVAISLTIGDATRPVEYEDIRRANRLLYRTAFLCEGICLGK